MTTSRRATLAEVARRAGVSSTTASYVLNELSDEMRISPETQQRVRDAAASLSYRPNKSARSLRTRTTTSIGLISDFIASGQFGSRMLSGARAAAWRSNHVLVIGETEGDAALEAEVLDDLNDRGVDGFVYARLATSAIEVPGRLRKRRTVLLNAVDRGSVLPAVVPDEVGGGRLAASLVVASGLAGTAPIVVVGDAERELSTAGDDRLAGISGRLRDDGLAVDLRVECRWTVAAGYDAVHALLAGGTRPGVVMCLNDRIAMGCYQALHESGLRIPDDVAVVSFDGSELAEWLRPRLTSVQIPYDEMGTRAVDVLVADDWSHAGVQRLPMRLLAGESMPNAGGTAGGELAGIETHLVRSAGDV